MNTPETNNISNTEGTPGLLGLKGFDHNFCCRGMQFEEGQEYHVSGQISVCENGIHYCTEPCDCFYYYSPASARYAIVVGTGKLSFAMSNNRLIKNTKLAASDLYVYKELQISELVDLVVSGLSGLPGQLDISLLSGPQFVSANKHRTVQVDHNSATYEGDPQDILMVDHAIMISTDVRGYAGAFEDTINRAPVAVAIEIRSVAYSAIAITLGAASMAKGLTIAIANCAYSIAYGEDIAIVTATQSAAATRRACSVAIAKTGSKVILYGDNSLGVVGIGCCADVYGANCTLFFMATPPTRGDLFFKLRKGTHLLRQDGAVLVELVVGVDIQSHNDYYSAAELHAAFAIKAKETI